MSTVQKVQCNCSIYRVNETIGFFDGKLSQIYLKIFIYSTLFFVLRNNVKLRVMVAKKYKFLPTDERKYSIVINRFLLILFKIKIKFGYT